MTRINGLLNPKQLDLAAQEIIVEVHEKRLEKQEITALKERNQAMIESIKDVLVNATKEINDLCLETEQLDRMNLQRNAYVYKYAKKTFFRQIFLKCS